MPSKVISPLEKIISGGQTGADQGGLEAGHLLGLATGGTAPKGYRTEIGPQPALLKTYGLVEARTDSYTYRTEQNVADSDATIWFGWTMSPGYKCTKRCCDLHKKPFWHNPDISALRRLLQTYNVKVLNVAGNRESRHEGIYVEVRDYLVDALGGGDDR